MNLEAWRFVSDSGLQKLPTSYKWNLSIVFKQCVWIKVQLPEIILIWHSQYVVRLFFFFKEFSLEWKIIGLTVLQSSKIGNVALVHLVFSCHWGKFNVPNIQDGSKYTVYTSKLLKHTTQMLASLCPWIRQVTVGTNWGEPLGSRISRSSCRPQGQTNRPNWHGSKDALFFHSF